MESQWMGSTQVRAFSWGADPACLWHVKACVLLCLSLCKRFFLLCCLCLVLDVLGMLCTLPGVWCQCVGVSSLDISLLCYLYSWEILYWLLKSLWHIPIWLPPEMSAVFGVDLHLHCLGLRVYSSHRNNLLVALFCI